MEQLPEYMKISYLALYNTTQEIACRIQMEHGQTVLSCLKRTVRFCMYPYNLKHVCNCIEE